MPSPDGRVVPAAELERRREARKREAELAHAEFAEFVRESQGEFGRTARVGRHESILSMRTPAGSLAFCFIEDRRVFVLEGETVKELPSGGNPIEAVIRIASRVLAAEPSDESTLSKDELAEVAATFAQVVEDHPGPATS